MHKDVVRRRRRQEAGRAAVLDAAAVPVARLRPGDRHRAADEGQVRRQDGLHPPGGLRRQRLEQGPAASRCRQFHLRTEPWLFVVNKHGQDHRAARGLVRRDGVRERRQDRRCETRVRAPSASPPALAAALVPRRRRSAHGLVQRQQPADPAVAVRVGGGGGARASRSSRWPCCGRRRGWRSRAWRRAARRAASRRARRSQVVCGAIGVALLRRDDRWPATSGRGHGAGQLRADVHPDHVLGRAGVRRDAVRRRVPRVQPVAGDRRGVLPLARAPARTRSGSGAGRRRSALLVFAWIELVVGLGRRARRARHAPRSATR